MSPSLPAPDLHALDGQLINVGSTIDFTYSYPITGFLWSLESSGTSASGTAAQISNPASVQGSRTLSPSLGLTQFALAPGHYVLSVQAQNGSQLSPVSTAQITLVSGDFSGITVYPNPWRQDRNGRNITFGNLPAYCHIKIFTVSGHLVRDLGVVSGSTNWNLANGSGDLVGSGLYLALITTSDGQKQRFKLAIIR